MYCNSSCWANFYKEYCPGLPLVEHRLCTRFSADCDTSSSPGWCGSNEFDIYLNFTSLEVVEDCVDRYSVWVGGVFLHYQEKARDLMLNIDAVQMIGLGVLFCLTWLHSYMKKKVMLMSDVIAR